MNDKRLIGLAMVLVFIGSTIWSQAESAIYASLEYFDNPKEIKISDDKGFVETQTPLEPALRLRLLPGTMITTLNSTAELRLIPNNSLIKLARNSQLKISSLVGLQNAASNDFEVVTGKLRMVAAKVTNPAYTIKTPGTTLGVRGTDFVVEVNPGKTEKVTVLEGLVEVTRIATRTVVQVAKGQSVDAVLPTFAPRDLSNQELVDSFQGLSFAQATSQPIAPLPTLLPPAPTNRPGR